MRSSKKILVVDDSETLRSELRKALEPPFKVIEAENGREGLKKAELDSEIRLIISDYNMPEMDGLLMSQKIRELSQHQKTPIFMLTTESTADLKSHGKLVGVQAWIVKPFNAQKLLAVIQKILI